MSDPQHSRPKRLFIFVGHGTGGSTARRLAALCAEMRIDVVCSENVNLLVEQHFDAVCFPGGSAAQQFNAIGERLSPLFSPGEWEWRVKILVQFANADFSQFFVADKCSRNGDIVRDFVHKHGGGYLGICAGAQLGSERRLDLMRGVSFDQKTTDLLGAGIGSLLLHLTLTNAKDLKVEEEERKLIVDENVEPSNLVANQHDKFLCKWHNGPFFGCPWSLPKDVQVLATVDDASAAPSNKTATSVPKRLLARMRRRACIVRRNNVVFCGPHPECMPHDAVARALTRHLLEIALGLDLEPNEAN